ncbi:putative carboxylesterase 17 [Hibiscus syriacus]|uniref:Carboxylesterase 17 n=1 Tax=Hibiscus syriacus TaxID=106335 RepID=A0A6A2XEC7_HIBSY|nr:probable carboxylesterase 17 [Hibiscus syriacus]KAE8654957.1 putative carboxylesterase 17 [Hibiscus syriacus]
MAAISFDPRFNVEVKQKSHGVVVEEIEGLIRVYENGHVERPPIIPIVPCTTSSCVTVKDVVFDKFTGSWTRIYVPNHSDKMPLLVYFHGGGFCVGSAAWSCYNEFLSGLASKAGCIILSVNYRLAPENRLPAAYDDGIETLMWVKQQALNGPSEHKWWLSHCDLSSLFLAGDSSGANIAYNVATRLGSHGSATAGSGIKPLVLKGSILIQPFFGGESRTATEIHAPPQVNSGLTLSACHVYWRLSLPFGSNRDHPWCNPLASGATKLRELKLPPTMVCVSEMDILKERNMGFCNALASAGKRVEVKIYKGVGHAFQVLHNSPFSQIRTQEMISHIKTFINQ